MGARRHRLRGRARRRRRPGRAAAQGAVAIRRRARQPGRLRQFRRGARRSSSISGVCNELGAVGWIAALVFAICMSLRLARFNVMADDPNRPVWAGNFFTGVPAPAGAIIVLLPIYVNLLGMPRLTVMLACVYTLAVAFLLVSTCRCCPARSSARACRRKWCCRSLCWSCCSSRCLSSYPWQVLTAGSLLYLACLAVRLAVLSRVSAQGCGRGGGARRPQARLPAGTANRFMPVASEPDATTAEPAGLRLN